MIKLFFFLHDHSGARTYADELLAYYRTRNDLSVYTVFFQSRHHKEFCVISGNGYTEVHLPPALNHERKLEKYSHRCLDLMHTLISNKENIVFHLNNAFQVKIGIIAREKYGVRLVYTLHFLPDYFSYMVHEGLDNLYTAGDVMEREMIQEANQVICVTKFAKKAICKWYNAPKNKVRAIHNGYGNDENNKILLEENKMILKTELGFDPTDDLILFVGLLEERKGLKYLVLAFKQLCEEFPRVRLVIAGDGDYSHVFNYAKECRGRITLTGKIGHDEVVQLYQVANIGVIPSIYEQCSYVSLEMMMHGLPVVVANAPGLNELYEDNKDALLVPLHKGSTERLKLVMLENELFASMEKLLQNEGLRRQFHWASEQKWEHKYKAKVMGDATLNVYNKLIEIIT